MRCPGAYVTERAELPVAMALPPAAPTLGDHGSTGWSAYAPRRRGDRGRARYGWYAGEVPANWHGLGRPTSPKRQMAVPPV